MMCSFRFPEHQRFREGSVEVTAVVPPQQRMLTHVRSIAAVLCGNNPKNLGLCERSPTDIGDRIQRSFCTLTNRQGFGMRKCIVMRVVVGVVSDTFADDFTRIHLDIRALVDTGHLRVYHARTEGC
jgi:hypothetical protein